VRRYVPIGQQPFSPEITTQTLPTSQQPTLSGHSTLTIPVGQVVWRFSILLLPVTESGVPQRSCESSVTSRAARGTKERFPLRLAADSTWSTSEFEPARVCFTTSAAATKGSRNRRREVALVIVVCGECWGEDPPDGEILYHGLAMGSPQH
jgi:hypothetical protein